jgi:GNAT superfamily N-acetyltransferase
VNRPAPQHEIVPATTADTEAIASLIALAFHPLAPSRWLIEDAEARSRIFVDYFAILVEHTLTTGQLHTTAQRTAAALWLPGGAGGLIRPPDYDTRLHAVTGPWVERFRAFDAALEQRHPTLAEHHYLAVLAVHPRRQGHGLGSSLLAAQHDMLDTLGAPAYLEASDLRTRQLYRRHGYTEHGTPIHLPDGPAMHPMWRHPAPPDQPCATRSRPTPGTKDTDR